MKYLNTREKIKQFLPLLEAYANGATLQYRSRMDHFGDGWLDFTPCDNSQAQAFGYEFSEYRVKPVPRTCWIVEAKWDAAGRQAACYFDEPTALRRLHDLRTSAVVKDVKITIFTEKLT